MVDLTLIVLTPGAAVPRLKNPSEKYRKWNAFLSVSASGPEYSKALTEAGIKHRPRLAATLEYASADVDFCEEYWREQWQTIRDIDNAREEQHERLREPSRDELLTAFERIGHWYRKERRSVNGMEETSGLLSPAMECRGMGRSVFEMVFYPQTSL